MAGVLLASGVDGMSGPTPPPIGVGKTSMCKFVLQRLGTHMHLSHADEMVQVTTGMMGLVIIDPRDPRQFKVDRDFGFILNAHDIERGSATPRVDTLLGLNLWTWSSRAFPGIAPFGPVGMGGLFSVVNVRDDVKRGDDADPGPYMHPAGTLAATDPVPKAGTPPRTRGNAMKFRNPRRCVALVLVAAAMPAFTHGDEAHAKPRAYDAARVEDTAFGRDGDPRKVARTIRLDMSDAMRYSASDLTVRRGETIRFVVHNSGQLLHEMMLGTPEALEEHHELMKKFPNMEHAAPNMAHVKPGATGQIVWQFTKAGRFQFGCLQAGHFEAGMVGAISVK